MVFRLATLISDLQIETWFSDLQLDFQACNFVFRLATSFSDLQLYFLAVNFILKLETWNLAVRTARPIGGSRVFSSFFFQAGRYFFPDPIKAGL